jgi:hypothetical protein
VGGCIAMMQTQLELFTVINVPTLANGMFGWMFEQFSWYQKNKFARFWLDFDIRAFFFPVRRFLVCYKYQCRTFHHTCFP